MRRRRGRPLRLLPAAFCAAWGLALPAQGDSPAERIHALERAFKYTIDQSPEVARLRREAIQGIRGLDGPDVADSILQALERLEDEIGWIEGMRRSALIEGGRSPMRDSRIDLDPLLDADTDLMAALMRLQGPATVAHFGRAIVRERRSMPFSVRLALASRLRGLDGSDLVRLGVRMKRAREAEDLITYLRAARAVGPRASEVAVEPALDALGQTRTAVRFEAARTLGRLRDARGFLPVLRRLEELQDDFDALRERSHLADALEEMTGLPLGDRPGSWRAYYADHQELIDSGRFPGRPAPAKSPGRRAGATSAYFGIPQDGDSIVYVIDFSGSMKSRMKGPDGKTTTRIARARTELRKAIDTLPDGKRFNVVTFATRANLCFPLMVPANARTRDRAHDFVAGTRVGGGTTMYDALELAFVLGGYRNQDTYYEPRIDTIFALTDGEPTKPSGGADRHDVILRSVDRWNPADQVVVHTIALGSRSRLLPRLARENRGRYVRN